jgi:hypothetical protein
MASIYVSPADTAKLLRAALKAAFPGVKFSVRTDSYSMGASIRVGWVDGPRQREVKKIARQYEGASFDGMTDMKSYHNVMVDGVETHYGADFIFTNRRYSVELLTAAAEKVAALWGMDAPAILPASEWDGARLDYRGGRNEMDFGRHVQVELEGS